MSDYQNKKAIIFDFDGTIADTIPSISTFINSYLEQNKYQKFTDNEIKELKNKNIFEILDKDLKIPLVQKIILLNKLYKYLNANIDTFEPIPYIGSALSQLNQKGYTLYVVSFNNRRNISKFLKNNNLDVFNSIKTGNFFLGKKRVLKNLLKENNINPDNAIYVGDEIRDILAARAAHIKIVAVTWGANSQQGLKAYKPDFLVDNPLDLSHLF